jgi:signal peptidase I
MFGIKKRRAPLFGGVAAEDDKDIEVQRARDVARHSFWAEARLLLRDLVFALMFAALLVVFVVQPVKVEGTSMLPRLHDGERIFVNKLIYYGLPELQRGDIIVFWYPDDPSKSYIKRIIGLPGESVEIRDGRVYITSQGREQALEEPYLDPQRNVSRANYAAVEVKPHYYFVMGDNRDASSDSRIWGLVPEKYIYGKALFRYWPLGSLSFISHESDYNVESPPPQPQPEPERAEPVPAGVETH